MQRAPGAGEGVAAAEHVVAVAAAPRVVRRGAGLGGDAGALARIEVGELAAEEAAHDGVVPAQARAPGPLGQRGVEGLAVGERAVRALHAAGGAVDDGARRDGGADAAPVEAWGSRSCRRARSSPDRGRSCRTPALVRPEEVLLAGLEEEVLVGAVLEGEGRVEAEAPHVLGDHEEAHVVGRALLPRSATVRTSESCGRPRRLRAVSSTVGPWLQCWPGGDEHLALHARSGGWWRGNQLAMGVGNGGRGSRFSKTSSVTTETPSRILPSGSGIDLRRRAFWTASSMVWRSYGEILSRTAVAHRGGSSGVGPWPGRRLSARQRAQASAHATAPATAACKPDEPSRPQARSRRRI